MLIIKLFKVSTEKRIFMDVPDTTFTIEAKILGQRASLQPAWQIALPTAIAQHQSPEIHPPFLLRDLITYIVSSEIQTFQQRQQERRLLRVLGPQQITDAAASGKITMGGPSDITSTHAEHEIDERTANITALQAFEDGLYFVFLNGIQQRFLEDEVLLGPGSTVTFIRLVALIGG
jgi:hypothetical protein